MTLKKILEDCYGIDLSRTRFALRKGEEAQDRDLILRSISENELVLESLNDEHPHLEIDYVEVDDLSNRTHLYVI